MKKFIFIAAIASAALVSCTKNEPAPSMEAQQEITFMTAPLTKAHGTFGETNRFRTWAFHDQADWTAGSATAQLYLGGDAGLEIQKIGEVWKNDTQSYYWPKTGKLTFYSYSLNTTGTFLTDATVACTNAGITVTGYDIVENLDVDFMVADQAADLTANTDPHTYYTVGVPTLFRHKLSNVIFVMKTGDDYAGKTFKLQSITLNNVAKVANYAQNPGGTEAWGHTSTTNILFTDDATPFAMAGHTPAAKQSYYIPQTFTDAQTATLVYEVITDNGSGTATETVTVNEKLSTLFGSGWEIGKKYTCTVTIKLNEILWDPAVEEWTGVNTSYSIN